MRMVKLSQNRVAELERLRRMNNDETLLNTAKALLLRIDHMTTDDFRCGGERVEREALRQAVEYAERMAAKLDDGYGFNNADTLEEQREEV